MDTLLRKGNAVANVTSTDKRLSQMRPRLYYVRVDTEGNQPFLQKRVCAELIITYLLNFQSQQ